MQKSKNLKNKKAGNKSGNYIEHHLCATICIICDAKLCRDLFAKNKVKKRKKNKNKVKNRKEK